MKKLTTVTTLQVLGGICEEISLSLLDALASTETTDDLMERLGISQKQYKARISKFLETGIIKRKGGKYSITSFGKLIHDAQLKIVKASDNLPRLMAIDAARLNHDITNEELRKVIDGMIGDDELKNIILNSTR